MENSVSAKAALAKALEGYAPGLREALGLRARTKATSPEGLAKALLGARRIEAAVEEAAGEDARFAAFVLRAGGEVAPAAADWWLRHTGCESPDNALASVLEAGLVFAVGGGVAGLDAEDFGSVRWLRTAGKLWVPGPIGEVAARAHPEAHLPEEATPATVRRAAPGEALRELLILARFAAEHRPEILGTTRGPSRRDLQALAGALGRDPLPEHARRLEGVPELLWLEAVGLAAGVTEHREGRVTEAASAGDLFSRTPAEQAAAALEAAVSQTRWGELETSTDVIVEKAYERGDGALDLPSPGARTRARRHVLRVLAQVAQPGMWHSARALTEAAMERGPGFLVRRRLSGGEAEPTYRGILAPTGAPADKLGMWRGWQTVEGAFVAQFLRESLARLGLVDTGAGQGGLVFRITPLGARVLGMAGADGSDASPGRFFVQPNFEIIADGGGDNIGAIWRLSRVAELNSYDRAATFTVTHGSVVGALEAGLSGCEILDVLSDSGRVELPQNVAFSVEEWADAFDRYELRADVWVVETDTPEELDRLVEELPGCLELMGETAARVFPEKRSEVGQALAGRDEVTEVDHATGLREVFALNGDMTVTLVPEMWNWYPEHLLSLVAEPVDCDGSTTYQLTRGSVRRGLAMGLDPEEVERFLESSMSECPSPEQVLKLRGWLGKYDAARLSEVTVLEAPPGAVSDLLSVPAVRDAVVGSLGASAFIVRRDAADSVRAVLDAAGIGVEALEGGSSDMPVASSRRAVAATWGRRRWEAGDPEADREAVLREAIEGRRKVSVLYQSVIKDDPPKEWMLSPEDVERTRWGQLRLKAFCHTRESWRAFDVGRMERVVVMAEEVQWEDEPPSE